VHPDTEVFTSSVAKHSNVKEKAEVGFLAPDFTLKDYNDRNVRLSDFRGKSAVMLNFWSGWCPFCLAEMPAMAVIEEAFKGKLEVIAVNRGQKKEDAKHFTDALNLSDVYTILLNPADDIFGTYGGFAMPSTFFIDTQGIIRDAHFGPLDSKQMREKIELKLGL
jgi:peroxiredoxin